MAHISRNPHLREQAAAGRFLTVTLDSAKVLISSAPQTVGERMTRALATLARLTPRLGHDVSLNWSDDMSIGYCADQNEFAYLITALQRRGLLRDLTSGSVSVSVDGFLELERSNSHRTGERQGFVAMNFDPAYFQVFELGIAPALEGAGFSAFRIDREEHVEKIDDLIMVEIARSAVVVADFTGHKAGVYFEAGYALGLGIPVVWTCREEDAGALHFDIRQYNQILWTSYGDLAHRLEARLRGLLGRPST